MTYQDHIVATADEAAEQALAAFEQWEAGKITTDALVALIVAFIAAANTTTTAIADLSLAAVLTQATGTAVAPLGITRPGDETDRLSRAAVTILDEIDPSDVATLTAAQMRLRRLAVSEALEAAARAYSEAIRRSPRVTGWTRGLSGNACQLCQWWSRDGRVWPDDHPMPTHKGCTCNPQPAVKETAA